MKTKILKAECHAHGVTFTTSARRLYFHYRDVAFTPEIRDHGRGRPHEVKPLSSAVLPKSFTLTRTV